MFIFAAVLLTLFLIILFVFLMATNHAQASPKDFFLHLLAIVTLYITAFSFGTLVFQLINFNFPDELYYFSSDGFINAIRYAISSLIVALPTYIVASRFITKQYLKDAEKRTLRIRTWLIYFTLFATAVTILISLMSIVYQFLGGELTVRFTLKVLTVLFIAGMIFGYYLYKVRAEKENQRIIMAFAGVTILTTLIFVILAFMLVGSPATQRARQFDLTRLNHLGQISNEIQYFFDQHERLPESLGELTPIYTIIPVDPQTQEAYDYEPQAGTTYQLCAVFTLDKFKPKGETQTFKSAYISDKDFTAGRNCFEQTVTINPKQEVPSIIR